MPIYEEMLFPFEKKSSMTAFCCRCGKDFPQEKGHGILFVGRVVNGGRIKADIDLNEIFDQNYKDGIGWVEKNMNQSSKQGKYNANNSAFWRTIKEITQNAYHIQNDWSSKIAWSNLYKVSPQKKGNPTSKQERLQFQYCEKILQTEIEILQPQFVIFLTSKNVTNFIHDNYGPTGNSIHSDLFIKSSKSNKYIKLYKIKDMYFITSYHPQGKPEKKQIKIISEMIKDKLIM